MAAECREANRLILSFCRQARTFFRAHGVYFWRCTPEGELIGVAGDGFAADRFRGLRGRAGDEETALEAVRVHHTVFRNEMETAGDARRSEFHPTSVMAAPLRVASEIVGVITFLHARPQARFDEDSAAKATILVAQMATALEALRLNQLSQEERRRTMILAEAATTLDNLRDAFAVMERIADRVRALLHSPVVLILVGEEPGFQLRAVTTETPSLAREIASRFQADQMRPAVEIASRAVAAGECISVSIGSHFGDQSPSGALIAAPLRTSRAHGAVLVYPRASGPFTPEEKTMVSALAGFGATGVANAELYRLARAQTQELEANRRWLEIFDAISDFIVVHDQQGNIRRVNRPLADFVGVAPDQLTDVPMRALDGLFTATSPHSCPFCRNRDALDEYVYTLDEHAYLVSTSRIHTADSPQVQTVHVLKDITDRREAERRYRELFDHIQEGIFFTTPPGRFVELNDAMVRILGYDSREEVLQLDIPTQIYFSPARRQELVRILEQDGGLWNREEVLRRKDGSPVNVLINCFAMRDAHGQIVQYRGLMLDITRLRHSQLELQRERDFSGKVLNYTQSLILVTGTDGVISYANRRWAGLGFRQEQLLGSPLVHLAAPARRDALGHALEAVAQGQQVDNFDLPLLRGDGTSGQFSVNLSPISAEDGTVTSIVVVMTDVTDSAILQAKLLHAEKMAAVGQLVSGVAHEVNNPLTAILGFTDLLIDDPNIPEGARRDLRVILQEAQRTKQIVQNLLSFARQMPPQRNPIQLNAILRRTVQLRAYDFHSHGVQVVERLDEALPEIIGDAHQLQQVFLNILNNAHDAGRESGRPPHIEITSACNGAWIEVSFRDNGVGIREPDRIFDPFFTTKEVGKGTGLGLSICYGIVREHGGEIVCHNNLDSEGATFIVRLPVAAETASFGAAAGVLPK